MKVTASKLTPTNGIIKNSELLSFKKSPAKAGTNAIKINALMLFGEIECCVMILKRNKKELKLWH
jgi:hypothetical protein